MVAGTVVVYARELVEPVIPGPSPLAAVTSAGAAYA